MFMKRRRQNPGEWPHSGPFAILCPGARVTEVRERPRTGPAHITALPAVRWSRGHRCGGGTARAVASSQCQMLTSPEPLLQAALDMVQPKFSHRATCHRTAQTSLFVGITALFLLSLFLLSSWCGYRVSTRGNSGACSLWVVMSCPSHGAPSHVSEVQESKQLLTVLFQRTSSTCFLFFVFCFLLSNGKDESRSLDYYVGYFLVLLGIQPNSFPCITGQGRMAPFVLSSSVPHLSACLAAPHPHLP